MAKFDIYSSLGVKKAEGYLTFTGTYMKAGVLDFREIGSPTPIDWAIGDYVDYTRTGMRYYLYTIPPVKRQTRNSKYGGAFLYQNVQFHDASYDFEICPFRDLVVGDNRIHFSTQPAISVFDNVAGIAERLGACLDDMYPGKWVVRVASGTEYDSLMAEDRDFSVSGVSIKGALDKVYEVWPEVGWVYSYEQVNGVWKNVLTIGGAGLNTADSYQYSKGNGLTSLARTVANGDELANRLYVYGSNRNMLPRWYNSQNIKDADSVDIQHLMLPVNAIPSMDYSGWGKTNVGGTDKPDPAKAYIEDATSIAARGLRPKTVYFDGSGDYKEIYPSIREMTMGKIRTAKQAIGDTSFVPAQSWAASDRADTILSVNSTFDDGMAASRGKDLVQKVDIPVSISNSSLFAAGDTVRTIEVFTSSFTPSEIGKLDLETILDLTGTITLSGINYATLWITVKRPEYQGDYLISEGLELERSGDNTFSLAGASFPLSAINITTIAACEIKIKIEIGCESQEEDRYATTSGGGNISFNVSRYRNKSFSITLRQIGFDIDAQSELGNGKTIAMRSGNCVGRSFRIAKSTYIAASDTWKLDVIRSNDESLSQWFPNSSYPIQAGDEFVLLDIAMPELYVYVAEERLLEAAQSLLEDTAKEQWQYNPEIDAKFMVDNSRTIMAANIINLVDANLVSGSGDFLVDSVTINEGESTIPTYKVTLRDKKKKTYSDKASIAEASSNPVSTPSQVNSNNNSRIVSKDSFFEVYSGETFDDKYAIKLKDEYAGLLIGGFLISEDDQIVISGTPGGGGGGGVQYLHELLDVDIDDETIVPGQILVWDGEKWVNEEPSEGSVTSVILEQGDADGTFHLVVNGVAGTDVPVKGLDNSLSIISQALQSFQSQIDAVSARNNYDELTATALFSDTIAAMEAYMDYAHANRYYLTDSIYFDTTTVNGVVCARLNAPLITSGDQIVISGTPGGGGSGGASYLSELLDVAITNPTNGQTLFYQNGIWVNGSINLTDYYTKAEVDDIIGTIQQFHYEVYASLSDVTAPQNNVLYLIGPTGSGADKYEEYVYSGGWVKIGDTSIDLSGYVQTTRLDSDEAIITESIQSLQSQIDAVSARNNYDELTASAFFADMGAVSAFYAGDIEVGTLTASGLIKTFNYVQATRFYLTDSIYFYTETINETIVAHLNAPFVTDGDQIILSGTPGGGGQGVGYLYELGDVSDNLATPTTGMVLYYDGTEWVGIAATDIGGVTSVVSATGDVTVLQIADALTGAGYKLTDTIVTSLAWSAITDKPTTLAGYGITDAATASFVSDLSSRVGTLESDEAIVSGAIQSLQSQIDSVSARNEYDELIATALFVDTLSASNAYIDTLIGNLSGNATTASYLVSASYSVGSVTQPVYFSNGLPAACTYTISAALYSGTAGRLAYYAGTNLVSEYYNTIGSGIIPMYLNAGVPTASTSTVGSASLPVYLNGGTITACTASSLFYALGSNTVNNLEVTIAGQLRTITSLYATYDGVGENISDKFAIVSSALQSLQSQIDSVATRFGTDECMATVAYFDTMSVGARIHAGDIVTTGDQSVASDATLKTNWRGLHYGIEDIANATAGIFDWKDGHGTSAGTIAQEWKVLIPELVHGDEGGMSLAYGQAAMLNTILLARHETEQDKEIRQLKARVFELETRLKIRS